MLVVLRDDLSELDQSKALSYLPHAAQEVIHMDPAARGERQSNETGFVAEDT
nr:hypothetical protein [Alloyangia mangrovi]